MLQARAYQRDGEDDQGSRCNADDYTVHLRQSFQMQSMSKVRYSMVFSLEDVQQLIIIFWFRRFQVPITTSRGQNGQAAVGPTRKVCFRGGA